MAKVVQILNYLSGFEHLTIGMGHRFCYWGVFGKYRCCVAATFSSPLHCLLLLVLFWDSSFIVGVTEKVAPTITATTNKSI